MKRRFKINVPEGIELNNIDLSKFNTNPVILLNHDHNSLPLGMASDVKLSNRGLYCKFKFHKLTNESVYVDYLRREGVVVEAFAGGYLEDEKFNIYEVSICR